MSNEVINPYQTFRDNTGNVLANGTVGFYVNTTSDLDSIFSDEALTVSQTNPYPLDAYGRIAGDVKYAGKKTLTIRTESGGFVRTIDNVSTSADPTRTVIPHDTLADAVADVTLNVLGGDAINIAERTTGNGGGAMWDVVLSSTVTENTYNIVQCTGVGTLSLVLRHNGAITPEQWGISDSTSVEVDDSVGVQALLDDNTIRRVNGDPTKTYFFSQIVTNKQKFTWDGGIFRLKRTDTLTNNTSWNSWPSGAAQSTGNDWLIRFTAPALGDSGVIFKNIDLEGNGKTFATSAGYANHLVQMLDVVSCRHIMFDNVNISRNNGNGLRVWNSEYIVFSNGSVLETVGLTGAITSFEQIALVASRYCTISYNDLGRMTPDSPISTVGGWADITAETEVGGFVPFNTVGGAPYNLVTWYGLACGTSDTFHSIHHNVLRSDLVDAAEAGGGGCLARMLTVNSGQCYVKDNIIYDTTGLSNGGIGLGHDETTAIGAVPYGRMASRTEVSGNTVFGFTKSASGNGILNNGSEDCNVHDNHVYNCVRAFSHTRFATTSRYKNNWAYFNDIAFELGDGVGATDSHGIVNLVEIEGNDFWNNLQDINMANQGNRTDLKVINNEFTQVRSNALVQFSIKHGFLEWTNNNVVNNSSAIVCSWFAADTGLNLSYEGGSIKCLQDVSTELILFDGDASPVAGGRGRLTISNMKAECPTGSNNRKVRVRRENDKGISISNPQLTNAFIQLDTLTGNKQVNGGSITTQGTSPGIVADSGDITDIVHINDVMFPSVGAATPITTAIASTGIIVVNSCVTPENKDLTDRANGAAMRNNDCWKVVAGTLTASRP